VKICARRARLEHFGGLKELRCQKPHAIENLIQGDSPWLCGSNAHPRKVFRERDCAALRNTLSPCLWALEGLKLHGGQKPNGVHHFQERENVALPRFIETAPGDCFLKKATRFFGLAVKSMEYFEAMSSQNSPSVANRK
jgi:hypothetical protein